MSAELPPPVIPPVEHSPRYTHSIASPLALLNSFEIKGLRCWLT